MSGAAVAWRSFLSTPDQSWEGHPRFCWVHRQAGVTSVSWRSRTFRSGSSVSAPRCGQPTPHDS